MRPVVDDGVGGSPVFNQRGRLPSATTASLALGDLSSPLLDQPTLEPLPLISLDQDVRPFETGSTAHLLANPSGEGGEVFLFGEASGAEKSGLPTSPALLGDPHNPALGTSDDVF